MECVDCEVLREALSGGSENRTPLTGCQGIGTLAGQKGFTLQFWGLEVDLRITLTFFAVSCPPYMY